MNIRCRSVILAYIATAAEWTGTSDGHGHVLSIAISSEISLYRLSRYFGIKLCECETGQTNYNHDGCLTQPILKLMLCHNYVTEQF